MHKPENVINGTWGECWLGNDYLSETTKLKAEIKFKKSEVPMPRKLIPGQKTVSASAEGSMTMQHVNSRMINVITSMIREGKEVKFTITSKLADPDALGVERVVLTGVSFDGMTIIDWERMKEGEREVSFTYEDYEYLEAI